MKTPQLVSRPSVAAARKGLPSKAAATALPRLPQRAAGKARFELLLDAADQLLNERDAGDISLYDIADLANVPSASVYHFLPSMTAACVALAQRYLETFKVFISEDLDHEGLSEWLDVFRVKAVQGRDYFNAHNAAMKLFLGSEYNWQIHQENMNGNQIFGEMILKEMNRHFICPHIEHVDNKMQIALGLVDSVWSLSFLKHGRITEYYCQEARRAFECYIRMYIPEYIPKRPFALEEEIAQTALSG